MGQAKRRRFRLEGKSFEPRSRPQTMQTCPSCNGKGREKVGIGVVRLIKCTQCGGKGRIPLKVAG
jgi:DnaJ-class molecular chaperone